MNASLFAHISLYLVCIAVVFVSPFFHCTGVEICCDFSYERELRFVVISFFMWFALRMFSFQVPFYSTMIMNVNDLLVSLQCIVNYYVFISHFPFFFFF